MKGAGHLGRKGKVVIPDLLPSFSIYINFAGARLFEATTSVPSTDLILKLQKIKHGTMGREIDIYKKLQHNGRADCFNIAHVI